MKKFNEVIKNKLILQAEEARDQKFVKLAEALESTLNETSDLDSTEYSHEEMYANIYKDLWVAAANVIKYYDVESVDAVKVSQVLEEMTNIIVKNVANAIDVDNTLGPLEPKVPGESK